MKSKKKTKKHIKKAPRFSVKILVIVCVSFALFGSGMAFALNMPNNSVATDRIEDINFPSPLAADYREISRQLAAFSDLQSKTNAAIVRDIDIQNDLTQIQFDVAAGKYIIAKDNMSALRGKLVDWNEQLSAFRDTSSESTTKRINYIKPTPAIAEESHFLPIILYHLTPFNFDQQLTHLQQRGYTAVNFTDVTTALNGGTALPAKPVIITFDDGFTDQLTAFEILKRHNMKATFYIISGDTASSWCIGANRRYGDPLQPSSGCGDDYMNWDQIRMLDESKLITIGAHTMNHQNLASDTPEQQRYEIATNKLNIEQELRHQIFDFSYPYGSYNSASIEIVRESGFTTATTTLPGTYQPAGDLFTLRRIRDALELQ